MRITDIRLRGILDSRARVTVEAEVNLDDRYTGRGSSPRAIAPGRRERRRGADVPIGALAPEVPPSDAVHRALAGRVVDSQREVDDVLAGLGIGAGATLAVSLAFGRAAALSAGQVFHAYLAELAGTASALPRLLVNVFSGGIHAGGPPSGCQQVMAIPATGSLVDDIAAACAVFAEAGRLARARYGEPRMSASSGLVVPASSDEQLDLLTTAIAAAGCAGVVSIGVDVAAEHLVDGPGRYRFGREVLSPAELADRLAILAVQCGMSYVEDPFDPADEDAWRALRGMVGSSIAVVGDDLFATDAARIDAGLADGILLKPSQAGTLTATLDAAVAARREGMLIAVSHRSGETDDTAMCDLAVAVGAQLIKVGGPRRGDRLAKYNQLLRLAEHLPVDRPVTAVR